MIESAASARFHRMPLPGYEVSEIELHIVGDEMTLRAEHRVPEERPRMHASS